MRVADLKKGACYFDTATNKFAHYRGYDESDNTFLLSQDHYYGDAITTRQVCKFKRAHLASITEIDGSEFVVDDPHSFKRVHDEMTFKRRRVLFEKYQTSVDKFMEPSRGELLHEELEMALMNVEEHDRMIAITRLETQVENVR